MYASLPYKVGRRSLDVLVTLAPSSAYLYYVAMRIFLQTNVVNLSISI